MRLDHFDKELAEIERTVDAVPDDEGARQEYFRLLKRSGQSAFSCEDLDAVRLLELDIRMIAPQWADGLHVSVGGRIDGKNEKALDLLAEIMVKVGATKLIFNMARLEFVNSTGLGAIIKMWDKLKVAGGGFACYEVPLPVRIVIEML